MNINIITGDCREVLAAMPEGSARCCVTSPPYFGLRDYGNAAQIGLEPTPDAYVAEMVAVFREVRRVLADDGTLWLNVGDSYAAQRGGTKMPAQTVAGGVSGRGDISAHRGMAGAGCAHRNASAIGLKHKDLLGIPWLLAFALRADGWYLRQEIIWHKPNPMPESVTDRCTKAHESVFLMSKSPRYFFDAKAIAEPAIHAGRVVLASGGEAKNANAGFGSDTKAGFTKHDTAVGDTRNRRSVWSISSQPFSGAHFATMPADLARDCILAGSAPGDTVLDPFGGAGTTGLAADRLGRNATLIELNPDFAEMARNRINDDGGMFAVTA